MLPVGFSQNDRYQLFFFTPHDRMKSRSFTTTIHTPMNRWSPSPARTPRILSFMSAATIGFENFRCDGMLDVSSARCRFRPSPNDYLPNRGNILSTLSQSWEGCHEVPVPDLRRRGASHDGVEGRGGGHVERLHGVRRGHRAERSPARRRGAGADIGD